MLGIDQTNAEPLKEANIIVESARAGPSSDGGRTGPEAGGAVVLACTGPC